MDTRMENKLQWQQNRVAQALEFREQQDAKLAARNPLLVKEPAYLEQKLEYFQHVRQQLTKGATQAERITLDYLRAQIRFLKAQLHPQPVHKVLFHPLMRALRNYFTGNYLAHKAQERQLLAVQQSVMQVRSYDNITKALSKQGLQVNLEGPLKRMIGYDHPAFSVPFSDPRQPNADFVMHCEKIPGTRVYYINKIDVVSTPSEEALHKGNATTVTYTVDLKEAQSLAVGQAAHLVNGKMVCKDGNTWVRYDPDRIGNPFHEFTYDLGKALKAVPLSNPSPEQLQQIENGLKSGRKWDVTIQVDDELIKCSLYLNPATRKLCMQDRNGGEVQLPKPQLHMGDVEKQMQAAQELLHPNMSQAVAKAVELNGSRQRVT